MITPNSNDERINAIIADYLRDVAAGTAPDRRHILTAYPDLAAELESFFADHDRMHRFVEPATLGPERPIGTGGAFGMIRYFGDYELLEEIARGGMGVVYKARQLSLNRLVALKMILAGQLADSADVERFRNEAQTAAGLQHPNIVAIHEVGEHFGQHYFSMDYVTGRNLAEVLRDGPLPSDRAAKYVRIIADAIDYAHQRGTLHRDVKPTNVLIDEFDQPRVTDFGLAKKLADDGGITATGAVLGTPSYMPPEQAAADRGMLSPASDVYSIGALLYHLVTGRPPFQAATTFETLMQVLNEEPATPRLLNPTISRDLETIILKCLAKDASRRYVSARELAHDLECYSAGQPIRARRPSLVERVGRTLTRHRRSAALMAITMAASIVAVLLGIAGLRAYHQSNQAEVDLATEGPSLLAEILNVHDDSVVATSPVPAPNSLVLPHGEYRLRLSSSGLLSETWPMRVPGPMPSRLRLRQQWLWPPQEVHPGDQHVPFPVGGRADLIVVRPLDRTIRRLHGGIGRPVWTLDLEQIRLQKVDNTVAFDGLRLFALDFEQFTVVPVDDVDSDGTPDLMLHHNSILAMAVISGSDGRLLWRVNSKLVDSAVAPGNQQDIRGLRGRYGNALLNDVDGDGVKDFLVPSFLGLNTPDRHWIDAISGKTGKSIWQREMSKDYEIESPYGLDGLMLNAYHLQLLSPTSDPSIGMVIGTRAFRIDPKTGADLQPPFDFAKRLWVEPHYFDGDGSHRFAFIHRSERPQADGWVVGVFSWNDREIKWSKVLPLFGDSMYSTNSTVGDSIKFADLDGDGRPEIIVAMIDTWHPSTVGNQIRESIMEVLDGADGKSRWRFRMPHTRRHMLRFIEQFIIGPDLDGDGFKEIFTASVGEDHNFDQQLQVTAQSGRDGRMIWRWLGTEGGSYRDSLRKPLRWWQVGEDSWPLLIVPVANGPGGQPIGYTFSAGTGRLVQTLPEVRDPRVLDLNGDGINDLLYTVYPQGAPRLIALRGQFPEPWRQFGTWRPAADCDGDGFGDLLLSNNSGLAVRSGRTGKPIWSAVLYDNQELNCHDVGQVDLNGDGIPDLVALFREPKSRHVELGERTLSVAALSGRDGQKIWQSDDIGISASSGNAMGLMWQAIFPSVEISEPDVDGSTKMLIQDHESLHVLASRTGQLLWRQEKVLGGLSGMNRPSLARSFDLNGDGVRDFVWWIKSGKVLSSNTYELQALNGRNGSKLWAEPGLETGTQLEPNRDNPSIRNPTSTSPWPYAVIGDLDGDGIPEVVAMRIRDSTATAANHEIHVLDGRTGKTKWRHTWFAVYRDKTQLPVSLRVGGATLRQFVAVTSAQVNKKGLWTGIKVLDSEGKIALETLVEPPRPTEYAVAPVWHGADVDGDGTDELLFTSEQKLVAMSISGQVVWQFELPSPVTELVDVLPASSKAPITVVIWSGKDVFGIAGPTGQLIWRCQVATQPNYNHSQSVRLLTANDPSGLPRVVLTPGEHWYTVAHQPWPTDADGKCQPVAPAPITLTPLELDPLRRRPLPWINPRLNNVMTNVDGFDILVVGITGAILGLVIWRRQWRLLTTYVVVTLVISGIMAGFYLHNDAKYLAADDRYSWTGWWQILLLGGYAAFWIVLFCAVVFWTLQLLIVLFRARAFSRARK